MIEIIGNNKYSLLLNDIHNSLQEYSKKYRKICRKICKYGSIKIIVNKNKIGSDATWYPVEREIHIKPLDTNRFIQIFIFEMTNAYNDNKTKIVDNKLNNRDYLRGRFGSEKLNFVAAREEIEYHGMKISNIIIDEMIQKNIKSDIFNQNLKWNIVDFNDYFNLQLENNHCYRFIDYYNKYKFNF